MKATLLLLISMKEFSIKAKPKKRWIFVCASTQTHFLINSDSQAFLQQYKADSGLITKQTLPMGPNTLPFPFSTCKSILGFCDSAAVLFLPTICF